MDLRIAPLLDCGSDGIAALVAAAGVSRFLGEEPYAGDTRYQYLVTRILADAERDDAVALGALADGVLAGLLVLRFPEWDRKHFGFVVARVEHLQGANPQVLEALVKCAMDGLRMRGATMCSARLSGDALPALHLLEARGFRFQELTLSPWRDLGAWERKAFGVTRPTVPADLPSITCIARRAFRTDRFHRDQGFSPESADAVYEKWVTTWHEHVSPDRHSLVLEADGRVAGFFMLESLYPRGVRRDGVASLVLDAVDPDVAGRGNGYRMYCDVLDAASGFARYASVVVAAANVAALSLFMKLGFRVTSSGEVTLHWWSDRTKGE